MALETRTPADIRGDRNLGNIYERLDAARAKREKILETPEPANLDWQAGSGSKKSRQAFPTLKPPRAIGPIERTAHGLSWVVPWLLGFAIFAIIFAFAVG